jgi:hypothetical protein
MVVTHPVSRLESSLSLADTPEALDDGVLAIVLVCVRGDPGEELMQDGVTSDEPFVSAEWDNKVTF